VKEKVASSSSSLPSSPLDKKKAKKKIDDWATRYATHTGDVARVLAAMVGKALQQQQEEEEEEEEGGGGALKGTFHFSSKEKSSEGEEGGREGGRAYTKYSTSLLIGEILDESTEHLEPDPDPPKGAPRPKDCEFEKEIGGGKGGREGDGGVCVCLALSWSLILTHLRGRYDRNCK